MHCRLAEAAKQHQRSACLLTYDEASCNAWIDRAEHFYRQRDSTTRFVIEPAKMKWLAEQGGAAVRQMCSLPATFVHGEFYASNILTETHDDHLRICPIDWETAAIGPGLIDLAALVAGSWTEEQKQQLATAYHDALPTSNRAWGNCDQMMVFLRCCRLFLALRWLGWSADWQPPLEHRFDWLAEAMQLA